MAQNTRAAIYCRLARKDDERIEAQKEEVLQYAEEQGYVNIALYVDNGASGSDFIRPAFLEMEADITAGKIGAVVVRSIDRVGRNAVDVMDWIDRLKQKGIIVKAIDGSDYDSSGSMLELIYNAAEERYKKQKCGG